MGVDHIATSGKVEINLKIEALNVKSKGESRVGKSRTAKLKSKLGGGGLPRRKENQEQVEVGSTKCQEKWEVKSRKVNSSKAEEQVILLSLCFLRLHYPFIPMFPDTPLSYYPYVS